MLPIPGTGSLDHVEENCAAALVELDQPTITELDGLAAG
jgi:aryl-alcohol dehydrogenase-like predicted oxidoreductase